MSNKSWNEKDEKIPRTEKLSKKYKNTNYEIQNKESLVVFWQVFRFNGETHQTPSQCQPHSRVFSRGPKEMY